MDSDDESLEDTIETGSDELLSDDSLRLPDHANPLVRLHAMRAWLARRQKESNLEMGRAALALQQLQYEDADAPRLRRREREALMQRIQSAQELFKREQEHLTAYEEAEATLEDCVNHLTVGERLLVEYYLVLEEIIQNSINEEHDVAYSPRIEALLDVQQRVERIGSPQEDD
ncbi:MAG: hypothetical protein NVS2B12_37510 [Ktedonobacteraceae bacterium]